MKKLSWLWVLLLVLGLAFGLSLGSCTSGGGGGKNNNDDDTADDDAADDDAADDDTEQFDVTIDQFTGPQLVIYYGGQIQGEIMSQLAMTADHLMLFGASLVAPGTFTIDYDYNNPPTNIDPAILLVLGWNLANPSQYTEAYFAYNAGVKVDNSGTTEGAQFTAAATEIKMIQAELTVQGQNILIGINPAGKKALVHLGFYNCQVSTNINNPHLCQ